MDDALLPSTEAIHGWIEEVFAQGVRRPGYPADAWAEEWIAERFRALGLDGVRLEPVPVRRWEPRSWSLEVASVSGASRVLDCFPLPFAAPCDGLEAELAAFDPSDPAAVRGRVALRDVGFLHVPADLFVPAGERERRVHDPDGTLGELHALPFGIALGTEADPVAAAGAAAFVGVLTGYPGDSCRYYVPYHGRRVEVPGVWVREDDGAWLRDRLAAGPVRVRLTVDAVDEPATSHNVVGELPGADDDVVIVGSHHDGPWASAVEDGSGIALVLAQAEYWARVPAAERPHRLVFLLHGGHMSGGAGLHGFIERHRAELDRVVLEVHLEHASVETGGAGGAGVAGRPVPRWFFTSRIPRLEAAVHEALVAEDLRRSMVLPPDAIGERPPTDGGFYADEGVPIVNFLAAPWYLFDEQDTPDKVDRTNLVPLTRATIRVIESTCGVSAAALRQAADDEVGGGAGAGSGPGSGPAGV
ncbi:MAG TPA: M28 family peptidase [Acidimicrobiales bacterium]